jgi:hydroxymethylpyrimidine/phosphomethylpyrimidine kinase
MITANIPEAYALSGFKIKSIDDVKKTCKKLHDYGPKYILVKGGHLDTKNAIDILYDGKIFHEFSLLRIPNKKAHGSGCSLSAFITGFLALGETPIEAVKKSKHIIWSMIKDGYSPGKGSDVLNHSCELTLPIGLYHDSQVTIWLELKDAADKLISILPPSFIPEVGMNYTYAQKNANELDEICAIDGRIVKIKDKARICGSINFNVSKHVASIVLAAMSFDKNMRSALNIRFSEDNLKLCKKAGFSIGFFNRKDEPSNINSTMEWGTKQVIKDLGFVTDVIYDEGGIGKEPMIRILGKNPKNVLEKLQKMIKIDNIR